MGPTTPSDQGYIPSVPMAAEPSTNTRDSNLHSETRTERPLLAARPTRRENLQPSYAQQLPPQEDEGAHGWYGSMVNTCGSIVGFLGAIPCCK